MGVFEHIMRLIGIFSSRLKLSALPCVSFTHSVTASIYLLTQFKYSHFFGNSGTIRNVFLRIHQNGLFQPLPGIFPAIQSLHNL
jgi:hypothetical protein